MVRLDFVDPTEVIVAFITLDHSLSGFHGMRSVNSHAGIPAVVHEDDVPASAIALDALSCVSLDAIGGRALPIEASHVPHHRLESKVAHRLQHRRAPRAKRRAKEAWVYAGRVGDGFGTLGELSEHTR